MKRYTKVAILALCVAFAGHVSGYANVTQVNPIVTVSKGPKGPKAIRPPLAKALIKKACNVHGIPHQPAWVLYVQGINSIEKITGGYRVSLSIGGGFVLIDLLDDL